MRLFSETSTVQLGRLSEVVYSSRNKNKTKQKHRVIFGSASWNSAGAKINWKPRAQDKGNDKQIRHVNPPLVLYGLNYFPVPFTPYFPVVHYTIESTSHHIHEEYHCFTT